MLDLRVRVRQLNSDFVLRIFLVATAAALSVILTDRHGLHAECLCRSGKPHFSQSRLARCRAFALHAKYRRLRAVRLDAVERRGNSQHRQQPAPPYRCRGVAGRGGSSVRVALPAAERRVGRR